MAPLALALMGAGGYGASAYLDGKTYTKEGIVEPKIGGFDAHLVTGLVGLGLSVLTGGLFGLVGAGAAVGSLVTWGTAKRVTETYKEAVAEYQTRQLAAEGRGRGLLPPVRGAEQNQVPPHLAAALG